MPEILIPKEKIGKIDTPNLRTQAVERAIDINDTVVYQDHGTIFSITPDVARSMQPRTLRQRKIIRRLP